MQIFTRIALRIGAIILIPGATSVIIAMLLGGRARNRRRKGDDFWDESIEDIEA